ncbi:MAG: hypothetical protein QM790_05610 [Nibricoccus sp.]
MYRTTKNVLEEYRGVWAGHVGFKRGYDDFNGHVTSLTALAEMQRSARAGVTLNKQQLRELMTESTLEVAGALCAFAHKTGNTELHASTNIERSNLKDLRDADIDSRALAIQELGVKYLSLPPVILSDSSAIAAADYGLSDAMLEMLGNRIAAYAAVAQSPRAATVKITTARQAVEDHIKATDEILDSVLDKLVRQFNTTKPDFVTAYFRARIIVDSAASRTTTTNNGTRPPTSTDAKAPVTA